MRFCFIESLAGGSITVLPSLCELFIELWPCNPAREDGEDRSGGAGGGRLLVYWKPWEGVRLGWWWRIDCERLEMEYVGMKEWRGFEGGGSGCREGARGYG